MLSTETLGDLRDVYAQNGYTTTEDQSVEDGSTEETECPTDSNEN